MAGSDQLVADDGSERWIGDRDVFHGEGAYWDAPSKVLRYVDMLAGDVISVRHSTVTRYPVSNVVALIRRRRHGGYVAALERGFALLGADLSIEQTISVFDDPTVRMNEGACDERGRLFCGSMAYDGRPGGGALYRLDPDMSVHVALDQVSIPNGLVWTDGGHTALHSDTHDRLIRAYDYDPDTGEFGTSRAFVTMSEGPGAPDGMALDDEGGLWVAMWNGGCVHRYDARGRLDHVIPLPVTNVTSCAFGGPSRSTLYITTSRQGIASGTEPEAGMVRVVTTAVRGARVHAFGG